MHHHLPRLVIVTVAVATGFLASSCSRHSRGNRTLDAANRLYASGRFDEAEIEYKNVIQLTGANPAALAKLGMLYQDQGRPGQALPFLLKAKELKPDDIDVRLKLGLTLLGIGNLAPARDEAIAVLQHRPADEEAPLLLAETARTPKEIEFAREKLSALPAPANASAPVLVALGQLQLRAGHAAEAEALFKRAQAANAKSPTALAALATVAWSKKDLTAAEDGFKKAAELSSPRSPRRLQYAQFKLQTGDVATATSLLETMTKETPDYIPAWLWRAEIALAERKLQDAQTFAETALARDAMHPEALLLSARVRMTSGEYDKAVATMDKMVSLYPQAPLAHYQLGIIHAAKGDRNKARESLARAVAIAPDLTSATLALADLNIKTGDFSAAAAALKPLGEKRPDALPVWLLLAEAYRGQGNFDAALAIHQQIEKQLPDNAQAPFLRGIIHRQQNRADAARAAFTRVLEIAPNMMAATEQLIDLDITEKKYEAARTRAEAAALKWPKSAMPHLLTAKIYLARNENALAEAALKRAIAAQPDSPTPYLALGRLYSSTKQYPRAIANLQELLAKNPNDALALTELAMIQEMQKDLNAARATYEKLLTVSPNSTIALNNLAYMYAEKFGQLEKAYEYAQRARALQPGDPSAADTLGWVQFRRGQYPQALPLLTESAAKLPDNPDALIHLALTHYMLGQETQARASFEQARKKGGDENEIRPRLAILDLDATRITANDRTLLEQAAAARPADPVALLRLSRSAEVEGKLPKAREFADAALQASPRNVAVVMQLARLAAAQGDRAQAIQFAKDARAIAADNLEATHLLAQLAYAGGEYRWSMSLMREIVDRLADDPDVQFDYALSAYSVGQIDEAAAAAQRAAQSKARFARAADARKFVELLALSTSTTSPDVASRVRQTLQSDPSSVPALMASASLSLASGDTKAAQQSYEKVLERFPEFAPAQKSLALMYADNAQDIARAAAIASKARQAYPTDPDLAKAFGMIVYRQGDFSRAATLLQESAGSRTKDGELQYYLGMSQLRLKKNAESKRSLQRALELGIKDELAVQARKSLASLN